MQCLQQVAVKKRHRASELNLGLNIQVNNLYSTGALGSIIDDLKIFNSAPFLEKNKNITKRA